MTDDEGAGVTVVQTFQQGVERGSLLGGAGVLGTTAVGREASDIADAEAMAVVTLTVSTDLLFGATFLDVSVEPDDIMIAYPTPTALPMPPVDVFGGVVLTCRGGTAMNDNKGDGTRHL